MKKTFWSKSSVAVIGGGKWGTVLAQLLSPNVDKVKILVRDEEVSRSINSLRKNERAFPEQVLAANITATTDAKRVFSEEEKVHAVIWALPSAVTRSEAARLARFFSGDEILIHATKGIEEHSLKRISQVLREEILCPRMGAISGPNLASEIVLGQPAATVVASRFEEVIEVGKLLFSGPGFLVQGSSDLIGVEWAGALKNVLAIAAGCLDAMGLGWNTRAMLLTRGLQEMVSFGARMGAQERTLLGLAGVGDLLATCLSHHSRNYRVGQGLAQGKKLPEILQEIRSTAEGVTTAKSVWQFAESCDLSLPITEGVYRLLYEHGDPQRFLTQIGSKPF